MLETNNEQLSFIANYVDTLLRITVNGSFKSYPCSSVELNFGLNTIPSAQVTIATGIRLVPGDQDMVLGDVADIHNDFAELQGIIPAAIYTKIQGKVTGNKQNWPDTWVCVFDGYVFAKIPRKTLNQLTVVLHLVHWLNDLTFSSMLSGQTHSSSVFQQTFRSIYAVGSASCCDDQPGGASASSRQDPQNQQLAGAILPRLTNIFSSFNVQQDFWANCIAPWFCALAKYDLFSYGEIPAIAEREKQNNRALTALQRMDGVCDSSRWYQPLAMPLAGVAPAAADSITKSIASTQIQSFATTTFWDVLVNRLAPEYLFAVSPCVKTAVVCPFVPGNRKAFLTLGRGDLGEIQPLITMVKPIRATVLLGGTVARSLSENSSAPGVLLNGHFVPQNQDPLGMVLVREAPSWLRNIPLISEEARNAPVAQVGAAFPNTTTTPVANQPSSQDNSNIAGGKKTLLDQFARWCHVLETLRGRSAVVSGRLRFDLAPGSTVFIKGFPQLHVGRDTVQSGWFGEIARVTISWSAQPPQAYTSFQLINLRTFNENYTDAYSLEGHPVYSQSTWNGAPLVEEYYFPEEEEGEMK